MRVDGVGRYALLGETQDDAAGEAFDKTAQAARPGLPGRAGAVEARRVGRARPLPAAAADDRQRRPRLQLLRAEDRGPDDAEESTIPTHADLARAFVDAVVEVLVAKCVRALETTGLTRLVVAGGVGANRQLRAALDARGGARGFDVFYPGARAVHRQRRDDRVRRRPPVPEKRTPRQRVSTCGRAGIWRRLAFFAPSLRLGAGREAPDVLAVAPDEQRGHRRHRAS